MSRQDCPWRYFRRLMVLLVLALSMVTLIPGQAHALSLDEYFSYSYSVQLSQTEVRGSEVFTATVDGQATSKKDLPIAPSEATVTSRVVARHQTTGTTVVLNPGYTLALSTFPSKEGESAQRTVTVPLAFPNDSQAGTYVVIGELIEARVRILVWLDVTSQLPPSQVLGTVTYLPASGPGGHPAGTPGAGNSSLSEYVDLSGKFLQGFLTESTDRRAMISIPQGTTGLTGQDEPLTEITIARVTDPPSPPANGQLIGAAYDFGPDGVTFDPPAIIRLSYDDGWLPSGAAEDQLTIALWDERGREWVRLDSTVDPEANVVAAGLSHFSLYAILVDSRPASFGVDWLSIDPEVAAAGEPVFIMVKVSNSGDLDGTNQVALRINGTIADVREVTLAGGASEVITFTTSQQATGSYTVSAGGLSETFVVWAPPTPPVVASFVSRNLSVTPTNVGPGEEVAVSILVANAGESEAKHEVVLEVDGATSAVKEITLPGGTSQVVTFSVSRDAPGTYPVAVDNLSGSFVVEAGEPRPASETGPQQTTGQIAWWWWLASVAAGIMFGLPLALLVARRRLHH